MDCFSLGFVDELVKTATPGLQAAIDKKLAPVKPPVPALNPPAAAIKPPAPVGIDQQMGQRFGQIRQQASAAGGSVLPKAPKSVMGVRG